MPQNLDPRLALLYEMTPPCHTAADIGTDHGYLICALVEQGKAQHGIAADINPMPLKKARQEAASRGLNQQLDFRLTDGLSGIPPENLEAVVIAGMGGETMIHIMESWPHTKQSGIAWLLQPMTKAERLRNWLWQNGFVIRRERCCTAAGRVYSVMEAVYTGEASHHPLWEHYLGAVRPEEDEHCRRYAQRQSAELRKIAAGLRSTGAAAIPRAEELEAAAEQICPTLPK